MKKVVLSIIIKARTQEFGFEAVDCGKEYCRFWSKRGTCWNMVNWKDY